MVRSFYEEDRNKHTDIGHALEDKLDVSDDGQLKIFGKEFDVGRNGAILLKPLVTTLINEVSLRGASTANRWGTGLSALVLPAKYKQWAAKIGKGVGFVWLFGLSVSDVVLGVKKTVNDGFKDMHELRDKWQPLLAVNNNMDVSVSKALTCNCGVFAHARAKVYENGKRNLLATVAGGIRAIPNIIMGVFQHQLNNIQNPDHAMENQYPAHIVELHKSGGTPQNAKDTKLLQELDTAKKALIAKQNPEFRSNFDIFGGGHDTAIPLQNLMNFSKDPDFFRRLRNPKNEKELLQNIRELKYAPALFGLGSELIERQITKKNQTTDEDAGEKILALQSYVHNHDHPDRAKVVTDIRDIFQQRAKDLHRTYELSGDTYDRVTEAVADAIVFGLHPQALAMVLDDNKIIKFEKKDADFGEKDYVRGALKALKERFTPQVSKKEFYKNEPLDEQGVVKVFKEMPEAEKPLLAILFPKRILEKTIGKADARKYHNEGEKIIMDELIGMTKLLMEESREELKKRGLKSKVIDEVESFKEAYHRAENNDHGNDFLKNTAKMAGVLRHVTLSEKTPGELWKDYLKKRGAESVGQIPAEARKGKDHVSAETPEETGIPGR